MTQTPGDTVQLGDITLMRGDCHAILPTLDLSEVRVCLTDPPYEISAAGGGISGKRQYLTDIRGNIDEGFNIPMLAQFKSWMVFSTKASLVELIQQAESQALRWQLITWNKTNPTPLCQGNYLPDAEYIIHAYTALPDCNYRDKSRWILGQVEKNIFAHPTVKPLYVMGRLIKTASAKGDLVIDPFMGTGTTGVVCVNNGRRFIGIESNPDFFDIAVKRITAAQSQTRMNLEEE
jgi:site-specific DNA-methyltransferase (adenine-specific)